MIWTKKVILGLLVFAISAGAARAQRSEEATVEASSEVLREIMAIRAKAIPASLLADAHGVMIVPGMVKGGFIVGLRHGKGVFVARNAKGEWTAPVFITVSGGSVGFQAGLQSTDVIAVFRNRESIDRLMRGKCTIGADAAVAAGPVGREALAATDAHLKAEILSYSRSRGLFAGVAIDGAIIQVEHQATAQFYAPKLGQPVGAIPASAAKLVEQIASYVEVKHKAAVNIQEMPAMPPAPQVDEVEVTRSQLAESSLRLHKVLDSRWQGFLALPGEVYEQGKTPAKEVLAKCLERYGVVSNDARYQALAAHAEFRETHALLLRYRGALEGSRSGALKLPPPPN